MTGSLGPWRSIRTAVAIGTTVTALLVLSRQVRYLPDSLAVVASADAAWLATAAGLSVLSVVMFAEQQRLLLRALGTRMSLPHALAMAYAQTSVTLIVPGGAAVATTFAVRQLRARGVSLDAAVGLVALSGGASVLGLAGSCAVGAVLAGGDHTPGLVRVSTALAVLALTLVVPAAVRSLPPIVERRWRERTATPDRRVRAPASVAARWRRMERSRRLGRETFRALHALRERDWYLAVALAVGNWVADMASLLAAARSVHVALDLRVVVIAYLAVQAGKYASLLPGGLGVVEPTLIVILAAGLGVPAAGAIVLTYRLFSYWLVALTGLPLWIRLNRRDRPWTPGTDGPVAGTPASAGPAVPAGSGPYRGGLS